MVFHGLLIKGRPLEARHETKIFQWEVRKTVNFDKKNFKFHFARCFHPNFSRFYNL